MGVDDIVFSPVVLPCICGTSLFSFFPFFVFVLFVCLFCFVVFVCLFVCLKSFHINDMRSVP